MAGFYPAMRYPSGEGEAKASIRFWDGKVQKKDDVVASQYGEHSPSDDPLVVAVHLPSVELREMVEDTIEIRETVVSEDVGAANTIQSELAKRFASDTDIGPLLGSAYDRDASKISFAEIADALAQFIRHEFRLRPTRLERFVFDRGPITEAELAGASFFMAGAGVSVVTTVPISRISISMRWRFRRPASARTGSESTRGATM